MIREGGGSARGEGGYTGSIRCSTPTNMKISSKKITTVLCLETHSGQDMTGKTRIETQNSLHFLGTHFLIIIPLFATRFYKLLIFNMGYVIALSAVILAKNPF